MQERLPALNSDCLFSIVLAAGCQHLPLLAGLGQERVLFHCWSDLREMCALIDVADIRSSEEGFSSPEREPVRLSIDISKRKSQKQRLTQLSGQCVIPPPRMKHKTCLCPLHFMLRTLCRCTRESDQGAGVAVRTEAHEVRTGQHLNRAEDAGTI
jgi:hypothetical protein